ncbi:alpha/beta hydrolase [Tsukamurella serpentis]
MPRTRLFTAGVVTVALGLAVSACVPAPAPTPDYVTDFGKGGGAARSSAAPEATGPQWRAAAKDPLSWQDCTDRVTARYGAAPAANATLQCASLPVRVGSSDSPIQISVTRARVPGTPDDAAPLILVGGTEFTGQRALATLASGDSPLLAGRPVVAVDRRGIGASAPLSCRTDAQRAVLRSGGPANADLAARLTRIDEAALQAAQQCGDTYPTLASDYTAAAAAADLEVLRTAWDVPALGLLAVGDGSITALAYAAAHPQQVARLILDSPVRYNATEVQRTEDAAKGTSATVDAFTTQCGPGCALGADPAGAVRDLIDRAASGRLSPFTDTDLRRAVVLTLGIGPGDREARITRLATALQAARSSDPEPLRALLRSADDALSSDGQYIGRCSDSVTRAAGDQIKSSAQKWGQQYRLGAASALVPAACGSFPAVTAPPALTPLEVPAVIATSAADPLTSRDALETLAGQLTVAGARPSNITWAGMGDGAVVRSSCVQKALIGHLGDLRPPSSRACPA